MSGAARSRNLRRGRRSRSSCPRPAQGHCGSSKGLSTRKFWVERSLSCLNSCAQPRRACGSRRSAILAFFDVYSAVEHVYDFGGEWAAVAARVKPLGLHLPPYASAGALFVLDARSGHMTRSAPLTLSVLTRRVWYLRAAVRRLGLLPV